MTTTTADTITATLAGHPDGITVRDLATEAGVGQSTAPKALAPMGKDGTATRTSGPASGNRKTADLWRLAATDEATDGNATPATDEPTADAIGDHEADDATATDEATPDATDDADDTTGDADDMTPDAT